MSLTITYTLFATGLSTVEGSPVPGFLAGSQAIFGMSSDQFDQLLPLRRWIHGHGGTVADETGTPAPVTSVDEDRLYVVTLGTPAPVVVSGLERVSHPCEECRLPVSRLRVSGPRALADRGVARSLVSSVAASWLATPHLVERLAAEGLVQGLRNTPVDTPAGLRSACWPERLLASHEVSDPAASRCTVCGRNVDFSGEQPSAWVPRYSLGLLVARPSELSGWWWHASLGQHLPILSGDVVRFLQEAVDDVTALPVILDPADAFLPEDYRP